MNINRVLILSSEFPPGPGGIGTHAHQLALNFTRLGVDTLALTSQDYASIKEIEEFNHAQPFKTLRLVPCRFSPLEALYRWRILRQAVAAFRPHVILASGARSVWLAAFGLYSKPISWLAAAHGTEFGGSRGLSAALTRWAFSQADGVVCVSDFTRSLVMRSGIQPKSSFVVHNGADTSRFCPADMETRRKLREKWDLTGRFALLTVGNLSPRKGQEVVIRALPEITHRIPQAVYLMAGLPTIQKELNELADSLSVRDHIRILSRRSDQELVELYQTSDLFLMTSRETSNGDCEGFGIAVIEAALCGRPAVVSDGSGLAEAVIDGCTGLVVPQEDPRATSKAVVRLFEDETLFEEMGEAARQRAFSQYSWSQVADQYQQILKELRK
jgi:phosphatidyl-myo-inositol dimannoside synthase